MNSFFPIHTAKSCAIVPLPSPPKRMGSNMWSIKYRDLLKMGERHKNKYKKLLGLVAGKAKCSAIST